MRGDRGQQLFRIVLCPVLVLLVNNTQPRNKLRKGKTIRQTASGYLWDDGHTWRVIKRDFRCRMVNNKFELQSAKHEHLRVLMKPTKTH